MTDYYKDLGIDKGSSASEIKKAYRKQALKYHPDKNPDDKAAAAQFKKVSEAYEVLSDSKKKEIYDRYGADALKGGMGGGPGGAHFSSMEEALKTFMGAFGGGGQSDSIFDSFFGGGSQGMGQQAFQGASKKATITISFEEAAKGVTKEIFITRYAPCESCNGSGASSPSGIQNCSTCHGHGQVHQSRGFFSMSTPCPHCHGSGKVITDPCKTCQATGKKREKTQTKVSIPAGIDNGMRIKMTGLGDAGDPGAPPGDLYIYVNVKPSDHFEREGDDLFFALSLSFADAALGAKKTVPTPLGKNFSLTIPAGTQSGKVFRIRGEGMKNVHGHGSGDLLVHIQVETPLHLSKEQKELLENLRALETEKNSPKKKSSLKG